MSKSVFITGGTGFLGIHLARYFIKKNFLVTLFDIEDLTVNDIRKKVKFIKGDVRDENILMKAIKGHEYVIHAAAALPIQRSKKIIFSVNVDGTQNVLRAALMNKVKKFIFISTTAVYGVPKHLPEKENSPVNPIGYYGQSKLEAEKLCQDYMKKGLKINIIRPKTFLGPERLGIFTIWFEAIYQGRRVFILGDGENKYQLLAVSDMVDAVYKSLTHPIVNEIFNIGAENYQSWKKDLEYVIKHEKSKSKITRLPVKPSQVLLSILEKLNLSPIAEWHYKTISVASYVSIEKAQKLLKWYPKKSNKELLLENYLWYKNHREKILYQEGKTHRVGWNFKIINLVSRL